MFCKKWIVSCYLKVLGTVQLVLLLIWQAPYLIYVSNWKRRQLRDRLRLITGRCILGMKNEFVHSKSSPLSLFEHIFCFSS